ncbi:MAG: hypothetical protein LBJ00_08650 [Planctomycetaceae bacterium]|nr:hypothetical protein [Planctomycetaceae bacterium]
MVVKGRSLSPYRLRYNEGAEIVVVYFVYGIPLFLIKLNRNAMRSESLL